MATATAKKTGSAEAKKARKKAKASDEKSKVKGLAKAKPKKRKKAKPEKRKSRLETDQDVAKDFLLGMAADKDVADKVKSMDGEAGRVNTKGVISTQCCTMDVAIGRGGAPLSRITILHGKEGGGKTTVALQLIAEVQQRGGLAMYIDKEHKLDLDYAESLGVDLSRMMTSRPKTLEGVIKVIKATTRRAKELRKKARRKVPILIVVDSLNACKAFETVETPTGKKRYPAEARIWSEEMPAIAEELSEESVGLILVSQTRKKMNVMFGSDEEISGGNAPKFFASLILYIQRIGTVKDASGEKTGSRIEVECKKNQISPPFKKAKFTIFYNRGIDYEESLVFQCEEFGWLKKKKGGIYVLGKKKTPMIIEPKGKGSVQAAEYLRSKPKVRAKLQEMVRKKMKWPEAA